MTDYVFGLEESDVVAFPEEFRTAQELSVNFSVSANQFNLYQNFKTPRHRGFYGYAQLMAGSFVMETIELQYVNQHLYYWFNHWFSLSDPLGCYFDQLFLCACLQQVNSTIVKVRIPLTAIRFRLAPGVLGNCVIRAIASVSSCDNNVISPPPEAGNQPNPDNGSYNPGDQPDELSIDPNDPTGNDGDDENAPKPGLPNNGGRWETVVRAIDPDFPDFTFSVPGEPGDDYQVVDAAPRDDVAGATCKPRFKGVLNGVDAWITDNCASTVLIVVLKRYVGP